MLAATLVARADVPAGYRIDAHPVIAISRPTVAALCGNKVTTERYRVARRVVDVVPISMPLASVPSIRQEIAVYDTAAHAALAMKEMRALHAACGAVRVIVWPGSKSTVRTTPFRTDATLPVRDNGVDFATITSTSAGMPPLDAMLVVQRQAQVLNIISCSGPAATKAKIISTAMRVSRGTGARQAKLR